MGNWENNFSFIGVCRSIKEYDNYVVHRKKSQLIVVSDRLTGLQVHAYKPYYGSKGSFFELLSNNRILSSSAEYHSLLGIWTLVEDFIGQLPSDEIALIDKFIQNPLLSYHQLSPSEQRLYERLPYINQLVRKIKEWLS